jgi:hypothetical protein
VFSVVSCQDKRLFFILCGFVYTETTKMKMRLLGLLPLIFFLAQGVHYWRINQLGHMLWMCNLGNLLLAMGLLLEKSRVVRLAAIWMVPGLIVWFIYVVIPWGVFLSSTLAHAGGITVAVIALTKYRMDRSAWRWAFGWYLMVQLMSRFVTQRDLNVNLAHMVQPGWGFESYWIFWITLTIVAAVVLWLSGLLLWNIWPADGLRSHRVDAAV